MGIGRSRGPFGQAKCEKFEAFLYTEQFDENTGSRDWVIDTTVAPFTLHREQDNMCQFRPYALVRCAFGDRKWIGFYSTCSSLAKARAFAFAVMSYECTIRKEFQNVQLVQLARTRELMCCAEYERELNVPWSNVADDQEAINDLFSAMGTMVSAQSGAPPSRPGTSQSAKGSRNNTGRWATAAHPWDAPVPTVETVKRPKSVVARARELVQRFVGAEEEKANAYQTGRERAERKRKDRKKLFDKEQELQRDFDALFALANFNRKK